MAGSVLAFVQIFVCASPQRPVRLTHWANSSSFPPESRATPSPGPRSRWTGGQESSQALTGGHWRGWTGCTMAPRTVRTNPLVRRLQSFGELQTFVVGNWGEGSEDLHAPRPNLCRGRVSRICRSSGRPEAEHLLGTIVGQYCRLISTCAVRAQAMCTLARVGLISPAAREAARRRQVAMRMEAQMKEERKAQWMASLRGPGWARRGRCHGV